MSGNKARGRDTAILSAAIENIDKIRDPKTQQIALDEFAATISETVSGYSNTKYMGQNTASKTISGSIGDPGIIKDFTGASADVSVTKSTGAGQSTNINQSEGKIFTRIQGDISNNSNPGVATQKVVSDISYVGKVSRGLIDKGQWGGVLPTKNIGIPKDKMSADKSFFENSKIWMRNHAKK